MSKNLKIKTKNILKSKNCEYYDCYEYKDGSKEICCGQLLRKSLKIPILEICCFWEYSGPRVTSAVVSFSSGRTDSCDIGSKNRKFSIN